jgi:NADH:ubiquinone oxidoreductase subunit
LTIHTATDLPPTNSVISTNWEKTNKKAALATEVAWLPDKGDLIACEFRIGVAGEPPATLSLN